MDLDGNGTIEFDEFVAMMQRYVKITDSEEDLKLGKKKYNCFC